MKKDCLNFKSLFALAIQFIKFSVIGVVNTAFNYLCYSSLVLLGLHYFFANTIAWVLGILLSYFLNSHFVFKSKPDRVAVLKTYVVYGISYAVTMLGLAVLIDVLHISEFIAPLVMLIFSVPFNFLAMKFWAMKKLDKTKKKFVVFDLDGTIFATHPGIYSSLQAALASNGFDELSIEQLKSCIGPPMPFTINKFTGIEGEELMRVTNDYREQYLKHGIYHCEPYPGMEDMLRELNDNGFRLAIATYKRVDISKKLIHQTGFDRYFVAVCGPESEKPITKCEILKEALDHLKAQPSETVMIGDSYYDYDAAQKCGCDFIGVRYGYGFDNAEVSRLSDVKFVEDVPTLKKALGI